MRSTWATIPMSLCILSATATAAAPREPKVTSLHPFSAQRGTTLTTTVRGTSLAGARAVWAKDTPFTAAIEAAEEKQLRLNLRIQADAKPGAYSFRIVTPAGVSEALAISITDTPVFPEPEGVHETPEAAIKVDATPAIISGRIAQRGESDLFSIEAAAGDVYTFQAISGIGSIGGPGGNARGFDPSLTLYEAAGSWFDPKRLTRIAFNDEPLWVAGKLTNAHLVHRFTKPGRYFVRLEAFSGQGGPDYSYQLQVMKGEAGPPDQIVSRPEWEERSFTRRLGADRMNQLAERGGKPTTQKSIESYRHGSTVKLPATIEGTIASPGEAHRAKFHLDGPQDIAIEVETPDAAPPLFNPIVRLLDASGEEVATNIFVGKGACTGAMTKSLSAKAIIPLRNPGDYTIEVRDTTADLSGAQFAYRVQVRPQLPHIGQVRIEEDHVNLTPSESKSIRVVFDREEDFRGAIAVVAESLPDGVQALAGADYEPDKDPPIFSGKRERYVPRTERTVVVFSASPTAPLTTEPRIVRLVARPLVDGKLGEVLATKEIPVMVVNAK